MDISSGDVSAMVFKRVVRGDTEEVSFDADMLMIFMELDGKKSLTAVAKKTGLKMSSIRTAIRKLMSLKLIVQVEDAIPLVDGDFLDHLKTELSLAIGPLAEIIIEDTMKDLGHDVSRFPRPKAAELVELLGRQIQREDKRDTFKLNMFRKIKEKEY